MSTAISAWTGSVSWNSSTRSTRKRRRKYAARLGAREQELSRPDEQVVEVGEPLSSPLFLPFAERTAARAGRAGEIASERIASWIASVASRSSTKIAFVRLQSFASSHHVCAPAILLMNGAWRISRSRQSGSSSASARRAANATMLSICGKAFSSRAAARDERCKLGCGGLVARDEPVDVRRRDRIERQRENRPVPVDDLGERADLVDAEPAVERGSDLGDGAVEETRLEVGVRGVERELRRQRVGDLERRIETRLDRTLAQERGREGVDRLDVGAVEAGQGVLDPLARGRIGLVGERVLEPLADAPGELGGCGLRERDDSRSRRRSRVPCGGR